MIDMLFVVAAYLIGSVPFALVSSRLFGLADPRSYGSGNPGATNVLRSGNKAAAAVTLLGDAGKGWLAVWLASRFGIAMGVSPWIPAACGAAAFLGHLFPVFIGFRGGKGVATALGVMIGFSGLLGAGVAVLWLATAALTRYSSAAALLAATSAPVLAHMLVESPAITAAAVLMAGLLIWRHKDNIRRLLAGTESRIGGEKS